MKAKVEKIKQPTGKNAWMAVFESLITLVMGIMLVTWPNSIIKIIAYIVGGFLLARGIYSIVVYYGSNKVKNGLLDNELMWGIISAVVGLVVMIMGGQIAGVFRIIVGIWIIYEALVRIRNALRLRAASVDSWKYSMIISVAMLCFGLFITFFDGAMVVLIGWMMIIVGVIGVLSDAMFVQYINSFTHKTPSDKDN